MEDELDMENQLEMELAAEQEELLEVEEEEEEDKEMEVGLKEIDEEKKQKSDNEIKEGLFGARPGLSKVRSLPANFTYNPPIEKEKITEGNLYPILIFHSKIIHLTLNLLVFFVLSFYRCLCIVIG